jgi:uncharacterized pyridoxamine 5'-phosphate oxidase family protein
MNYNDILEFVTANPICTIATSDKDQPHVRAFLTNIIDGKIYFTTSLDKKVGQEIVQNQLSELCYLSSDFSRMLRITTTIDILDNKNIKQHLIDTREYLKHFNVDDPSFILFTLSNSVARFWKLEDNLKENNLEKIQF